MWDRRAGCRATHMPGDILGLAARPTRRRYRTNASSGPSVPRPTERTLGGGCSASRRARYRAGRSGVAEGVLAIGLATVGMLCSPVRNGMVWPIPQGCVLAVTPSGAAIEPQWPGCSPTIRGEPATARDDRAATLYSVAPCGSRTMKQSFASAAGLRGSGPILTNGAMTVFRLGSPLPWIVSGQPDRINPAGRAETVCLGSLILRLGL